MLLHKLMTHFVEKLNVKGKESSEWFSCRSEDARRRVTISFRIAGACPRAV
jgi:hypothetical protein